MLRPYGGLADDGLHDCRVGGPGCTTQRYHYDDDGRLTAREERGGELNPVTLDGQGRFVGERWLSMSTGEEISVAVTYDGDRVVGHSMDKGADGTESRLYEYDDQGRFLGWEPMEGSTTPRQRWTWTDEGVTIEGGGSRVEVDLDELGRLREVRGFRPVDSQISLMSWRWRDDGLLDGFFFETWGEQP